MLDASTDRNGPYHHPISNAITTISPAIVTSRFGEFHFFILSFP